MNVTFICSESYWLNGWLNTPAHLKYATDTLTSMGMTVSVVEVNTTTALTRVLQGLASNTLVWPNAYYTQTESGEVVWLQELIEQYKVPYVGTQLSGLQTMLNKTQTQQALAAAGVAVPPQLCITRDQRGQIDNILHNSTLGWPVVVKPTAESCSMGVLRAETAAQAREHILKLFQEFPNSDALLEPFLPSEDITCGFLKLGEECLLLPTYYKSLTMPGSQYVMERDMGIPPWSGSNIVMPLVQEKAALRQLRDQMPRLAQAMGHTCVTRADARMDTSGVLRFFDVNGMPALTYPKSLLVRQVSECFPTLTSLDAYRYLLRTLITIAAQTYGLPLPQAFADHNLFTLSGGHALRQSIPQAIQAEQVLSQSTT